MIKKETQCQSQVLPTSHIQVQKHLHTPVPTHTYKHVCTCTPWTHTKNGKRKLNTLVQLTPKSNKLKGNWTGRWTKTKTWEIVSTELFMYLTNYDTNASQRRTSNPSDSYQIVIWYVTIVCMKISHKEVK